MSTDPRPYVHVITPGDHFSPRTGSAVPTVVDGLSRSAGERSPRSTVVVARGTYADRYDSADVVEYESTTRHLPGSRYLDPGFGRIGLPRFDARRTWSAALRNQDDWPPSVVFAHNGPQLVPRIDVERHLPVLYAHNDLLQTYRRRELARTLGDVAMIVCVSDFLASRTARSLPAGLSNRIRVVPNGVDCEKFHPRTENTRNVQLNVVYVGRTIPQKGPDVLLTAAARLDDPDITIQIVGSHGFDPLAPLSGYEQHLRALAQPLGNRVRFTPTVPRQELPSLLRHADVLVVPSKWPEPFGLTVLEGMASGIPVIASAVGGIPDAMGRCGIQVRPDDPVALADALESIAGSEHERLRMAIDCRRHAEAHDWRRSRGLLDGFVAELG